MEYEKLKDLVYKYKTNYEHGFTNIEIQNLLEELNINERRFNKALGCNTCMIIDGNIITYHTDVLKGIVCSLENREQSFFEFD